MEEEKAAAYYNELLGKGRNAALFKQGLGFGSTAATAAPAKHGMINFVGAGKATEAGEPKELDQPRTTTASAAKYGMIAFVGAGKAKEARKEEPHPVSKPADREGDGQTRTSLSKKSPEDVRSRSEERSRRDNKGRSRSPSKEKRGRHRSRSREPRGSGRRRSRSHSGSRSERSRRSESRERSRSPLRKRSRQDQHRSRSRSRDRGRSRSRSRDRGHRYHRDRRSRSRDRSRRNHRDRRSRSRDRSRRHHRDRRSRSRSRSRESDRRRRYVSRSRSRERSRREYKESRGRSKSGSPGRRGLDDDRQHRSRSDRRQDTRRSSPSGRQKRTAMRIERDLDWAKLIPEFDSMTPAEKVKAKMKFQLSQTVVKDTGKGVEEEWERFDFNKDAPLDGDAKQDYFGDGTGASTDTAQIENLGGSHLFMTEQAKREARLQAAHEAAIFGAPVVVEDKDTKRRSHRRERESRDTRGVDDDGYEDDNDTAAAKVSGVVSEQIIALQAGSSWQERIKKMRAAQAQDES